MSATTPVLTEDATKRRDALVERLFMATIDTLEIGSVHIGGRLGFYRALADSGDATPAELAARTGTAERYVREWLEQQAVAGFLSVDDPDAEPGDRRYGLPDAHRPVFADESTTAGACCTASPSACSTRTPPAPAPSSVPTPSARMPPKPASAAPMSSRSSTTSGASTGWCPENGPRHRGCLLDLSRNAS